MRIPVRFILFVLCAMAAASLHAQTTPATQSALQLVPPDGVALVTLQVKSFIQDESMRMMPWEVMAAAAKSQFGIDPMTVERIDFVGCLPAPTGLRAGALVTLTQDISAEFLEQFEQEEASENKGVELYALPNEAGVYLHRKDARHLLVGTKLFLIAAAKSKPSDGPLRKLASGLGEPGMISVIMAMEPVREILMGSIQSSPLPAPTVKDVQTLVEKADLVAIRVSLGNASSMATLIQAKSASDASGVSEAAGRLVKQGLQVVMETVKAQAAGEEGRVPKATLAYLQRLAPEIEKNATFKVTGNRAVMNLTGTQIVVGQIGVGAGLLLPAVQAARQAARRMQSVNNLKQIILAHHNYESTYKRFPNDKDVTLDNKAVGKMEPNLSWRVHILPYVEQVQLYNEFHLDEPWDSTHNIKLLDRMPEIYAHPNAKTKSGHTVYQRPTGKGLGLDPRLWVKMSSITDGTSNTILVIETKDEAAVPWTKPGDVNPLEDPSVFRNENGSFNVAMGDGSVQTISIRIDPEKLKALLTINGGEAVGFE